MDISETGLRFIAGFEGYSLYMYNDPYNASIGIGRLIHYGVIDGSASERIYENGITFDQMLIMFQSDVTRFVAGVNAYLYPKEVNQNKFDALVSFSYNCGLAALNGMTRYALDYPDLVRAYIGQYIHAEGVVLEGLVRRRAAEADLYERPVIEPTKEEDMVPILVKKATDMKVYLTDRVTKRWVDQRQFNEAKYIGTPGPFVLGDKFIDDIYEVPHTFA